MADLCPHRVPVTAFCKRCADEKAVKPVKAAALSADERSVLKACEATIRKGLASFLEVGEALLKVRDGRLYRADYGTFEAYCQERWGFSRRQGGYLIEAAKMGTMVPISNERQARALAPLADRPEAARDVVETVAKRGKVTAKALAEEVATRAVSDAAEQHRAALQKAFRRRRCCAAPRPSRTGTPPATTRTCSA